MPPKTVPRTKGNVRAANSSRAAELAGASSTGSSLSMSALGGFAQFATPSFSASSNYVASTTSRSTPLNRSGSSSPQLSGSQDTEVNVVRNGELSMIIKRLTSKRDTTTKVRALEDLEKWIRFQPDDEEGASACYEAIGPWIKLYIKLTTDVDRRVRLITNNVHSLLVKRVKKKLAPYLKDVVAAWIGTFFDPTRDVSRVASESFKTAFPDNKQEQVVSFCLQDMLYYISETLLEKTPETLSDPRFTTKEEMDTRYARVAASSLYTIGYIIETLSPESLEKGASDIGQLLDQTKFWAFIGHINPIVRRASYSMLRAITSKAPSLIQERLTIISKQFFPSAFSDKDTTTHGELWDALLVLTKNFPESWSILADKKPTMTIFYSFLKAAGYGSATVTYRSILPLISSWADESVLGKNGTGFPFVKDFFEFFWKGLESSNIEKEPGSTPLFFEAYIECLVYFIVRFGKSEATMPGQTAVFSAFTTLIKSFLTLTDGDKIASKFSEDEQGIAKKISLHLVRLLNIPSVKDRALTELWEPSVEMMREIMSSDPTGDYVKRGKRAILLLSQIAALAKEKSDVSVVDLTEKAADGLVQVVAKQCSETQSFGPSQLLSSLAVQFEVVVFSNPASQKAMHDFFNLHFADVLLTSLEQQPSSAPEAQSGESLPHLLDLLAGYLSSGANEQEKVSEVWKRVMEKVLQPSEDEGVQANQQQILQGLLQRSSAMSPAFNLHLDAIDKFVVAVTDNRSHVGSGTGETLITSALTSSNVISDTVKMKIFDALATRLDLFVAEVIGGHEVESKADAAFILNILQQSLDQVVLAALKDNAAKPLARFMVAVFDLSFQSVEHLNEAAQSNLDVLHLLSEDSEEVRFLLRDTLTQHIQRSIQDLKRIASPEDLANQAQKLADLLNLSDTADRFELLSAFFFDQDHWDTLRKGLLASGPQQSLAMQDALVEAYFTSKLSSGSAIPAPVDAPQIEYDSFGLSAYGRLALFTIDVLKKEGQTVSLFLSFPEKMTWVMSELLKVRQGCLDSFQLPSSDAGIFYSPYLHEEASNVVFRTFLRELAVMVTQWITLALEDNWEAEAIKAFASGASSDDDIARCSVVYFIAEALKSQDGFNERILADILQAMAKFESSEVSSANAKAWSQLLRKETLPLSIAVGLVAALRTRLENTNDYTTLLNYWASELGATRPQEVSIRNAPTIRRLTLLVAAVSTDGDEEPISNLPQHRTMNLLQSIRRWTDSDALQSFDSPEQAWLHALIFKLLSALARQVQELPGAHWEMMFEMVSSAFGALEASEVTESSPSTMIALERASRLTSGLIYLGEEEDDIMSAWEDQSEVILVSAMRLIGRKASSSGGSSRMDRPVRQYLESLSQVCGFASDRLVLSHGSVSEQCQLLMEPLTSLQMLAYKQLQVILVEQVQALSIQLEIKAPTSPTVDQESEGADNGTDDKMTEAKFPEALWSIISNPPTGFPAMDVHVDADDEVNLKDEFSLLSTGHHVEEDDEDESGVGGGVAAKSEKVMSHSVLGYLLGWKLAFGLFENTTYTVKSGLVAQLRDGSIMAQFLPYLFHLLGIHSALPWMSESNSARGSAEAEPFDLSRWDITDYQVAGFDLSSPEIGFPVLAGHLYYTCLGNVPSLVRIWWTECKLRQLSIAVETLTEKFFSPLLINRELNSLIQAQQGPAGSGGATAAAAAALSGVSDDLNELQIKTSKATSEVTASFQIDEATMEIVIRLPTNFPLRQVEVEGLQRVGVKEARWRAWLLAVAGVIAAQNGSLIDALTLFRRNVGLHFEGVEDCTICYSIVSLQDRSLPNKTCKTCKHRFHASCLYKWFRTSNSSSCPLCRTLW